MPTPAQAYLVGDRSIRIARSFDAPRHVIWQAFTDRTILAQWLLGPPGWAMDLCEIALQPGGGYHWRWRCAETDQTVGFKGTYSVVEPGLRLIDKQVFDLGARDGLAAPAATKNVAVFRDDGAGCRVTTTIRYPYAGMRDHVVGQGLCDGVEASYQCLDRMLMRAAA
ncbi:SRPBCC domain-containing protein [Rhodobacteraceae bacterium N5(2021)]|uniref:SRPBCC domain-containing protein n=1 Tax=Gymnodinialimonas phycosphaerae TaxID=2841589 RepID=A0A975TVM4_9RHOB|nr:SRPBCC domain-containing protein [Gymnodinialimonas phycosphaerae]MBY4891707.1 SRPBCC domain-containing protein [Gymnodinialimonas phycosphaerae]